MTERGSRIGAIRNSDSSKVCLFGFGTYEGEEIPPEDVSGAFGRIGLYGLRSPKLLLDDGTVVWGCESWWGAEDKVLEMIGGRPTEVVKPQRTPPTDKERRDAVEIRALVEREVNEILLVRRTVRKVNWAGPCIDLGPLVRETAKFYVYDGRGGRERRISKSNPMVHLEPCKRCVDHPETDYPRGFDL